MRSVHVTAAACYTAELGRLHPIRVLRIFWARMLGHLRIRDTLSSLAQESLV